MALLNVHFFPLLMILSPNPLLYPNASLSSCSLDLPGVAPFVVPLAEPASPLIDAPYFLPPVPPTSASLNQHNLMLVCHTLSTCSSKYFWQENSTRQHKIVMYSSLYPLTRSWFVHFIHSFIQHLFESYNMTGPGNTTINKIFPLPPQVGTGK